MTHEEYEVIANKLQDKIDNNEMTESTADIILDTCYDKYIESSVEAKYGKKALSSEEAKLKELKEKKEQLEDVKSDISFRMLRFSQGNNKEERKELSKKIAEIDKELGLIKQKINRSLQINERLMKYSK